MRDVCDSKCGVPRGRRGGGGLQSVYSGQRREGASVYRWLPKRTLAVVRGTEATALGTIWGALSPDGMCPQALTGAARLRGTQPPQPHTPVAWGAMATKCPPPPKQRNGPAPTGAGLARAGAAAASDARASAQVPGRCPPTPAHCSGGGG